MNPSAPSEDICAICGKDTSGGRGFMTLHVAGQPVVLCCPQCKKVYDENPDKVIRKLKTGDAIREIERGLGLRPPD